MSQLGKQSRDPICHRVVGLLYLPWDVGWIGLAIQQ